MEVKSSDLPLLDIHSSKRKSEAKCKLSTKILKIQKRIYKISDLEVESVTALLIRYSYHNLLHLSLRFLETHIYRHALPLELDGFTMKLFIHIYFLWN